MSSESAKFFLFIGTTWYGGAAADKVKASGFEARRKSLYSKPENWVTIRRILADPMLAGAIVKLTPSLYSAIANPYYRKTADELFRALGTVPNSVFVHESVLSGDRSEMYAPDVDEYEDDDLFSGGYAWRRRNDWRSHVFVRPSDEDRSYVTTLLEQCGISAIPYKTNAEMSVLAMNFVDENERNLLFRFYIPSGRLYATEADKLISLFRDWLSSVGRHAVRQDGYKTAAGQVYEFFGDSSLPRQEIAREFDTFSRFLNTCVENPETAAAILTEAGLDRVAAERMTSRYGKEVRRLQLDIRQEREARLLAIRHSLESDLLDSESDALSQERTDETIESLVPDLSNLTPTGLLRLPSAASPNPLTLNINQQFIRTVQGSVVQNIQGTANLGTSAKELMTLISNFGDTGAAELESAVHEFEDPDARPADRLAAKQRLKAFLFRLGGTVEEAALLALQKYLETKMISAL